MKKILTCPKTRTTSLTDETIYKEEMEYRRFLQHTTMTEESDDVMPVSLAVSIRTGASNQILRFERDGKYSYVAVTDEIKAEDHPVEDSPYYTLLSEIRDLLMTIFNAEVSEAMRHSALVPMGVFVHENRLYYYFQIVVKDSKSSHFIYLNTDESATFDVISSPTPLSEMDKLTMIVIPTLNIVNEGVNL